MGDSSLVSLYSGRETLWSLGLACLLGIGMGLCASLCPSSHSYLSVAILLRSQWNQTFPFSV